MVDAAGVRVAWADLPAHVRTAVADILGSPVVAAVSQPGGFSPGSADRVAPRTGGGRSSRPSPGRVNPHSPGLHRREIGVAAALPAAVPAPRLLGSHDDGDWVVLVLTDVEGRHPRLPWEPAELEAVRLALERVAEVPLTDGLARLSGTGAGFAEDFAGWHRLRDDPSPTLDAWAVRHLDRLADGRRPRRGARWRATGSSTATSAPTTCSSGRTARWSSSTGRGPRAGPGWFDRLALLVNVGLYDADAPLDDLLAAWLPDVAADDVDAVLSGLAAYFVDVARRPDPPGLPTVRAFQRAQGEVVLRWLRRALVDRVSRMTDTPVQRSFVLIKPDAVRRGLVGAVLARFEAKGLRLVTLQLRQVTGEESDQHYAEHVDRPFYPPLRTFITSGPSVALVVEGDEAIEVVRALNGATDGRKAAPGTIRGDYSLSNRENLVHGSDSPESAAREIAFWFPELG